MASSSRPVLSKKGMNRFISWLKTTISVGAKRPRPLAGHSHLAGHRRVYQRFKGCTAGFVSPYTKRSPETTWETCKFIEKVLVLPGECKETLLQEA